jgi:hypothetical protein
MRKRKKPSEAWLAMRFAVALSGPTGTLSFPLSLEPGERPDVMLHTPSGTIGLEITEAIYEQLSQAMSMAERRGLPDPDVALFAHGHMYSPHVLAAIDAGEVEGDGCNPKASRAEWTAQIAAAIGRKLDKPSSAGYRGADTHALLVYDNTGLFFGAAQALEVLTELSFAAAGLAAFDTVSVLTGAALIQMTIRSGGKDYAFYRLPSEIVG